jgi:8-oxo-dGTP pyrophosphatase MutT (NUDIX family)
MQKAGLDLGAIARALAAARPAVSSDYDLDPEAGAALPADRVLRQAAVLVPLVERGAGLNVILTRRSGRLRNHPGQVAFPGGRVDPEDASLLDAALREAEEEVGLSPADVALIGRLDTHETVTRFAVTPFVAHVADAFRPRPEPSEVEEVFEVPLAFLVDPANLQLHSRPWQGVRRTYYAIPYGPHYIWGATARMLKSFADRLAAA